MHFRAPASQAPKHGPLTSPFIPPPPLPSVRSKARAPSDLHPPTDVSAPQSQGHQRPHLEVLVGLASRKLGRPSGGHACTVAHGSRCSSRSTRVNQRNPEPYRRALMLLRLIQPAPRLSQGFLLLVVQSLKLNQAGLQRRCKAGRLVCRITNQRRAAGAELL